MTILETLTQWASELGTPLPDLHDQDFPLYLCVLSNALASRFGDTGDGADLDKAVWVNQQALDCCLLDDPLVPAYLANHAAHLQARYEHAGNLADLDRAISQGEQAVQASAAGDENLPAYLHDLSDSLRMRFEHAGTLADLDRAIEVSGQALQAAGPAHPRRALLLSTAGSALRIRFEQTGHIADLSSAFAATEESVTLPSEDPADRYACLSNHGLVLQTRFEYTGNLADLDQAIHIAAEGAQIIPPGDPQLAQYFSNLSNRMRERFEYTGELADLDEAVSAGMRASDALPEDHTYLAVVLFNVAGALVRRFGRTSDARDLDLAVTVGERALRVCPPTHRYRAGIMSSLGNALQARFDLSRDGADLDRAIALHEQAVQVTGPGHPDQPGCLSNLGLAQLDRAGATGDTADLDRAVANIDLARQAAPPGHPGVARYLFNHGRALLRRFEVTGNPADREQAMQDWSQAAAVTSSPVQERLLAARGHAELVVRLRGQAAAVPAYAAALDLLPLLTWRGAAEEDQRHMLETTAASLARDAAACAISSGDLSRAVELLEAGRSVLWSQLLETRTDLTELDRAYPELAAELAACRAILDQPGGTPGAMERAPGHARQTAEARREAARRFDDLVGQVRTMTATDDFPHPETFLGPPKFETLLPTSTDGHIVIVNISLWRCDALAVSPEGVTNIELHGLTNDAVEDLTDSYLSCLQEYDRNRGAPGARLELETAMTSILEWLWDRITGPVLSHLGYSASHPAAWPRVWWCPTGPLTLLPLHAAGHHGTGNGDAVYDRVVSSYATTLRAHARACAAAPAPHEREGMLIVSVPNTPRQRSLPGAAEEQRLLTRLLRRQRTTVLTDQAATRAQLLTQLARHDWVHASCHGTQDLSRPGTAGLVPYDWATSGLVGITDLSAGDQPGGEFAFLSACKTATGGATNLDEAITITAAMQHAGWRHVIGTLWSVGDRTALAVTGGVYPRLVRDGLLHPAAAAEALHQAVRQLRQASPGTPSAWAPFIHVGP